MIVDFYVAAVLKIYILGFNAIDVKNYIFENCQ